MSPRFSIWGRYPDRDFARLARNRFSDAPGAYYRVRYMPSERYPGQPYVLAVYGWEDDANAYDHNGEVREAVK